MNQWDEIVNESMSLQDRLELANVEDLLRNMIKKTSTATQEEQDRGLIFLIVNSSGLSIFSKNFVERDKLDDQLIAGLISAINSFSQDTFKTDKPIERIKQGENTLIIKKLSNFNICYVFKGSSYFANKKMNDIYTRIEKNKAIMNELTINQNFLPLAVEENLIKFVNETFS